MKEVLKVVLSICAIVSIVSIGICGIKIFLSDTEIGWKMWGWLLITITICLPTIDFWRKKMFWLLDL